MAKIITTGGSGQGAGMSEGITAPTSDMKGQITWRKDAADANAGAETTLSLIGKLPANVNLNTTLACWFIPDAALTHHASNYATMTVSALSPITGAAVELFNLITDTTDWTSNVPVALQTAGNPFTAGDSISVKITKAASGVVVPAGALILEYALA